MSRTKKLDFTGVESFQTASEGVHVCKIVSVDEKTSSSGNDMLVVAFEVIKGADKTARVYENYPLLDKALWKLKGLLQAIGMKADGKVQLDLDRLVGKTCQVTVKHEEYEGKTRARVDAVSKIVSVEEDEDDEDFDDINTPEEEEEEKPVKNKATKKAPAKKVEEEDDDDDWDDDEDDEEPAPKKKAPKKEEKKPAKKAKKADDDDDDWDDDDWDEDED